MGEHHYNTDTRVVLNSDNIQWKGSRGVTCLTNHHCIDAIPNTLYVKSSKTGVTKEFFQVHDEDGFDGEFWKYESDDGITVTILND